MTTYDAGTVVAELTLNRRPFQAGLAAARREVAAFERNDIELDVILNVHREEEFDHVFAEFERHHEIDVDVDTDTHDSDRKISSLIGLLAKLATVTAAAGLASNAATAGVGGLVAVVGALAQSAGAALLVPAAITAVAFSVNALKVASKGFGEALASMDDPAKFAEAIKNLAPSARESALAFQGLKEPLDALQLGAQQRLFTDLGKIITQTGKNVLPQLGLSYEQIAIHANAALLSTLRFINTSATLADIDHIADNSALSFGHISEVLKPLASVFIDLTAVGSEWLVKLTDGAGSVTQQFADMVHQMRESGRLDEIIGAALETLRTFGSILGNVGSILGAVFHAGQEAGGGLLNVIDNLTAELAEFLHSTDGQETLKAFFQGLGDIARSLGPVMGGVAQVIKVVAPILGDVGKIVGPALGLILNQLANALKLVGPGLEDFVQGVADLAVAISPLLPPLGELVGDFLKFLGAELQEMAPFFGDLAEVLGGILLEAVRALVPVMPGFLGTFKEFVGIIRDELQDSAPLLIEIAEALSEGIAEAIVEIVPLMPELIRLLLEFLEAVLPVLPPLVELGVEALPVVVELLKGITLVLSTTLPIWDSMMVGLTGLVTFLAEHGVPAFARLADVVRIMFESIAQVERGGFDILVGIIQIFAAVFLGRWDEVWEGMVRVASGLGNVLLGLVRSLFASMGLDIVKISADYAAFFGRAWASMTASVVQSVFSVIATVSRIPAAINAIITSLYGILYNAGRNILQSFINGMVSRIQDVSNTATSVVSAVRNKLPFSPAKEGPFSGGGAPIYSGISIANQIAEGLQQRRHVVEAEATGLARVLSNALQLEFNNDLQSSVTLAATPAGVDTDAFAAAVAAGVQQALRAGVAVQLDRDGTGRMIESRQLEQGRR